MCALFDSATYPTEYGSRDLDLIVVGNATTDHTLTCEHAGPRAPFDSLTTLRPTTS